MAESDWIRETTDVSHGSHEVMFADPVKARMLFVTFSAKNTVSSEVEFETIAQGSMTIVTSVTYANRTWTTSTQSGSAGALPLSPLGMSEQYRVLIANRDAVVVGKSIIDGKHALILREALAPLTALTSLVPAGVHIPKGALAKAQASMARIHTDDWINAATYVPIRTHTAGFGPPETLTYTWIPRTPSNLARTKPVIPPGFKHLVQPAQPSGPSTSWSMSSLGSLEQQSARCPA